MADFSVQKSNFPFFPRFAVGRATGTLWMQTDAGEAWRAVVPKGPIMRFDTTQKVTEAEILPPGTVITITT